MRGLAAIVAGLILFPACAVMSTEFSRSGFYVGASLLGAASNLENIDKADDIEDVDYTAGIGLRGGYRFLDRFAIELAFQALDDWNDYDIQIQNLALQGRFYPLTGAVQPYVLGGIGSLRSDFSSIDEDYTGGFVRLGAGLEIYILDFLPIFAELEYTAGTGSTDMINYTDGQVGVLFRF